MDILVAAVLLIVAVGLVCKRPIKLEITHKHIVETNDAVIVDPNTNDKSDPEVERSINGVIASINEILNGGESIDGKK